MTIEFHYSGDISHLSNEQRKQLNIKLEDAIHPQDFDYLDITRKTLSLGGSYNGDHYTDFRKVEKVLTEFEIDWYGGASSVEY